MFTDAVAINQKERKVQFPCTFLPIHSFMHPLVIAWSVNYWQRKSFHSITTKNTPCEYMSKTIFKRENIQSLALWKTKKQWSIFLLSRCFLDVFTVTKHHGFRRKCKPHQKKAHQKCYFHIFFSHGNFTLSHHLYYRFYFQWSFDYLRASIYKWKQINLHCCFSGGHDEIVWHNIVVGWLWLTAVKYLPQSFKDTRTRSRTVKLASKRLRDWAWMKLYIWILTLIPEWK